MKWADFSASVGAAIYLRQKGTAVLSTRRVSHNEADRRTLAGFSRLFDAVYYYADGSFHKIKDSRKPRRVFVFSGGVTPANLLTFTEQRLREGACLKVLVLAGSDRTFPKQIDQRHNGNPAGSIEATRQLVELLSRNGASMWVENLDTYGLGINPLPTGFLPGKDPGAVRMLRPPAWKVPQSSEPRVLLFQRTRDGSQWDARREVEKLAETVWADFVDIHRDPVSIAVYRKTLKNYPLNLCVEGGGLDPSPKAFETLWAGSIPIIRRSATSEAYRELPVIFVDEWAPESLSLDTLVAQTERLKFDWPDWSRVRRRLTERYWWKKVIRHNP